MATLWNNWLPLSIMGDLRPNRKKIVLQTGAMIGWRFHGAQAVGGARQTTGQAVARRRKRRAQRDGQGMEA